MSKVIANIASYHDAVKERVRTFIERKKTLPDDVSTFLFVGKHTHEVTLNLILGFLEFLVLYSEEHV